MKKFISKQRNCLITMLVLIAACELLLKMDNIIFQSFGICLAPFILCFGLLLFRNDKKDINVK